MYLQPIEGTMKGLIYNPEINPKITILLGNGKGCWGSLANNISANLCIDNIQITFNENISNDFVNEFAYYNGKTHKNTREVQGILGDNEKMEFVNGGTPLWFENTEYYKKRKIIDRINKNILIEYSKKLGIDITSDCMFKSNQKSLYVEL
jgi:hypothetical protein